MSLAEVSNILWRERQYLEMLVFKLEEEQLVLSAGRSRWIAMAAREVEMILEEIKRAELMRAVQLEAAAAEHALGSSPTLRDLADRAPGAWSGIFTEHRKALLVLTADVEEAARSNRDLLTRGGHAIREALGTLEQAEPVDSYDPSGRPPDGPSSLGLVNEAM
jgi:hypothetical protein